MKGTIFSNARFVFAFSRRTFSPRMPVRVKRSPYVYASSFSLASASSRFVGCLFRRRRLPLLVRLLRFPFNRGIGTEFDRMPCFMSIGACISSGSCGRSRSRLGLRFGLRFPTGRGRSVPSFSRDLDRERWGGWGIGIGIKGAPIPPMLGIACNGCWFICGFCISFHGTGALMLSSKTLIFRLVCGIDFDRSKASCGSSGSCISPVNP